MSHLRGRFDFTPEQIAEQKRVSDLFAHPFAAGVAQSVMGDLANRGASYFRLGGVGTEAAPAETVLAPESDQPVRSHDDITPEQWRKGCDKVMRAPWLNY